MRIAAIPRTAVAIAVVTRIAVARLATSRESHQAVSGGVRGARAGSSAGISTSVRMPQSSMPCPMSKPSSSRLGKSTTASP